MAMLPTEISEKTGLPPGSLVFVGEEKVEKVCLIATVFSPDLHEVHEDISPDDRRGLLGEGRVVWVSLDGIHEAETVRKIGEFFKVHPLVLEDVLNTGQRPKLEEFDDFLFVVMKILTINPEGGSVETNQISMLLGSGWVLTFQEKAGGEFQPVRHRLKGGGTRIRRLGGDYLFYALFDVVVDSFFAIVENIGEQLEQMEDEVIDQPGPDTVSRIFQLRKDMLEIRRAVLPLRGVADHLEGIESSLVDPEMKPFFRDVYDHTVQLAETVELFRDAAHGLMDLYHSSMANRMNEVMKTLTIIATIFIPLTFIAGVYGMNFKFMPELEWWWGYFAVWGVMVAVGTVLLIFFRKRKWL
jgi:magnesium transporter